jgi:hypothetical protein
MKLSKLVKNGANGVIFLPHNQFKNNQYKWLEKYVYLNIFNDFICQNIRVGQGV